MTLLDKVIGLKYKLMGCEDRREALLDIKLSIDTTSPFEFAKMYRVLENESAEEFMIQFMTAFNKEVYHCY